ncbi:MAG TPA: peptide chain release factor 2 [Acidimicrobiales bacterium]|nr:peptide chain release factor 2 [Acidimicrobiales bacterium]
MDKTAPGEPSDWGAELGALRDRFEAAKVYLRLGDLEARLAELETVLAEPELWSDPDRARKINTEYGRVRADVEMLNDLERQLTDAEDLLAIGLDEGESGLAEVAGDLRAAVAVLGKALDGIELRSLFSGEHDDADAIAEIHAGAGGTDAQDWAEMMLRMYLRWAERHGFEVEIDEVSEGQEAGILSATFIVKGRHAYGLLATERGVHRLVRMSPFDSQHRRQTSFASMDVVPFLDDIGDAAEIDEKDLRIDTYRSSGAGGQHVNKTDSAVRLTHIPTGVVVAVQNERSQHQNKAKAMQILAAKLADLERAARKAEFDALSGPESDVAWGNQIRSYVMAPYQLVKDLRTSYETGNVDAVLDGDLDDAMTASLRWRREHHG